MSRPELTAQQFWQFSCRSYEYQDTAAHALALQDNHGVNVNMLLFLCWCLRHRVVLNLHQFGQLKQAASDTESALTAHRQKRRNGHPDKGGDETTYAELKQQELHLEREQQQAIVAAFAKLDNVSQLPAAADGVVLNASLAAFIHCYQLKEDKPARGHISIIVNQLAGIK